MNVKFQNLNEGLRIMKEIYEEAYRTNPIYKEGFDAMSKIFIKPLILAIRFKNTKKIKVAEKNLKLLFRLVGETYNPEFPKDFNAESK